MRVLGLLGGMSWESTSSYYQRLNRLARERLGGRHSAELLIWSADFSTIADLQAAGEWAALGEILADAARRLEVAGAEALMICANTMHNLAPDVQASLPSSRFQQTARGEPVKRPTVQITARSKQD